MKAYDERYAILTNDLDFGDLLAADTLELPSVVIFRLQNMCSSNVNKHLDFILGNYTSDLEMGKVVICDGGGMFGTQANVSGGNLNVVIK